VQEQSGGGEHLSRLHRWAAPESRKTSSARIFLASDLPAYATGSIVMADGGYRVI
jgi:enoyl-[acyl-carrier-protein] reductase (NADH)